MTDERLTPLDHYANVLRGMAATLTDQSDAILKQARRNTWIAVLNVAMAFGNIACIGYWLWVCFHVVK